MRPRGRPIPESTTTQYHQNHQNKVVNPFLEDSNARSLPRNELNGDTHLKSLRRWSSAPSRAEKCDIGALSRSCAVFSLEKAMMRERGKMFEWLRGGEVVAARGSVMPSVACELAPEAGEVVQAGRSCFPFPCAGPSRDWSGDLRYLRSGAKFAWTSGSGYGYFGISSNNRQVALEEQQCLPQ